MNGFIFWRAPRQGESIGTLEFGRVPMTWGMPAADALKILQFIASADSVWLPQTKCQMPLELDNVEHQKALCASMRCIGYEADYVALDELVGKAWDEEAHPRHPAGSDQGGQFAAMGDKSGADTQAHIKVEQTAEGGVKVTIGDMEKRGQIVEPFEPPKGVPQIPEAEAIYLEDQRWKMRFIVDTKAHVLYTIDTDSNGAWHLRSVYRAIAPQDKAPLSASNKGSAAWAEGLGISWSKGSSFDDSIAEAHEMVRFFPDDFSSIDKLNEKMLSKQEDSPSVSTPERALRFAGQMEAIALGQKTQLPSAEALLREPYSPNAKDQKAYQQQVSRWLEKLAPLSRQQAMEELGRELKRLDKAERLAYGKMTAQVNLLVESGKTEEASQFAAQYYAKETYGPKRSGVYLLQKEVTRDLCKQLLPSGQGNNPDKLRPLLKDLSSSVDVPVRDALANEIGVGAQWLADHLHPQVFSSLHENRVPSFEVRAAANEFDRAHYRGGDQPLISLRPENKAETVVHEYGHHLDAMLAHPGLLNNSFVQSRSAGPRVSLRRLTGNNAYREEEMAYPDRFIEPYVGKDYQSSANEVVSVGLEKMFEDPVNFYRNDREHFMLTVYVMRGGL